MELKIKKTIYKSSNKPKERIREDGVLPQLRPRLDELIKMLSKHK